MILANCLRKTTNMSVAVSDGQVNHVKQNTNMLKSFNLLKSCLRYHCSVFTLWHNLVHHHHHFFYIYGAKHRHQSPEWTILSHVNCFIQREVIGFQVLLDSVSNVLRPHQHSIGYTEDGFYRSKDPTNSIKVLKEDLQKRMKTTKTTKYRYT